MAGSWSMDDIAAASAELEARIEAARNPDRVVSLGNDADLLFGSDLTRERARHRPVDLRGSRESRARVREQERAKARRELYRQNQGEDLPASRWPGWPRSLVGVVWLVVWAVAVVVELSAAALVRVAEPRVTRPRKGAGRKGGPGRVRVAGVVWMLLGLVLFAGSTGGAPAVLGAAAMWAGWMSTRPRRRR